MKKKENIDELNGLTLRHVAQIVRRKMITKDHGNKNVYSRKKKHKGREHE
jgi:hypothetical protein